MDAFPLKEKVLPIGRSMGPPWKICKCAAQAMTDDNRQLRFRAVTPGRPVVPLAVSPKVVPAAYRGRALTTYRLDAYEKRADAAGGVTDRHPPGTGSRAVGVRALGHDRHDRRHHRMIGVFVDFLTYLQAFHA